MHKNLDADRMLRRIIAMLPEFLKTTEVFPIPPPANDKFRTRCDGQLFTANWFTSSRIGSRQRGQKHMWLFICTLSLMISVAACAAAVLMQPNENSTHPAM